jgi:hypothetical protein
MKRKNFNPQPICDAVDTNRISNTPTLTDSSIQ